MLRGDSSQYSMILAKLRKHNDAYPFLRPVDWKRLGLSDYLDVIKNPIDLQTIGRRVRDGQYDGKPNEFQEALQLVWDNCKTYNDRGTEVYEMGVRMEEYAKEVVAQVAAQETSGVVASTSGGIESKRRRTGLSISTKSEPGGASIDTPDSSKRSTKKSKKHTEEPPPPMKEEEIPPPISGPRKDLMNKLIMRFRRLTPKNAALVIDMIFREQEAGALPHGVTSTPAQAASPSRRGGGGSPKGELVDLNLTQLDDGNMQRLCSVIKCFLFKQSIDLAAS